MKAHEISSASILRSILFRRLGWRAVILSLSLLAAVLGVLAPYAQKNFTDSLISGSSVIPWIWMAFFFTLGAQCLAQASIWFATRESLITQKSLADKSYQRLLMGAEALVGRRPAGEAVSLFAVDVPGSAAILDQALVMACGMFFPLLLAPIALHMFVGIPWAASFGAIAVLGMINYLLARRQSKFFYFFKQLAAERTGLVAEWVQNIRMLRILGWVKAIEKKIFRVRERETENRIAMVTNGQVMNTIAGSSTFVLNILAVVYLIQLRSAGGNQPTAGEMLSLLWIIGVFLVRPLRQFPWVLVIGMDSYSSIVRLQKAMNLPVTPPRVIGAIVGDNVADLALDARSLRLEIDGKCLLNDLNLSVRSGEFVGIVGEVGSGKTLLLQSLMGATSATYGSYSVFGKKTLGPVDPNVRSQIAFVPQEGFTMSATLRENVMFTYKDEFKYAFDRPDEDVNVLDALERAQFYLQRENITQGLNTDIGERGVNLSGGQRQRVSIARAKFSERPILLLDDCLSAVDVDTERHLLDELFCKEWKARTRILVTHRMSVLPHCDRILFMENGNIIDQGTYANLLSGSEKFRDFVHRIENREG